MRHRKEEGMRSMVSKTQEGRVIEWIGKGKRIVQVSRGRGGTETPGQSNQKLSTTLAKRMEASLYGNKFKQ